MVAAVALGASLALGAACSLAIDTGGLTGGSPPDAAVGAIDAGGRDVAVEAAPDAAGDTRLVAEWRFDEPSGGVVEDSSGNRHHGTIGGGSRVGGRAGGTIGALKLDGNRDVVVVPASAEFDRGRDSTFTMTAWMRRDGPVSHAMFVSVSYGDKDSSFGIELETDTTLTYWDSTTHAVESPVVVPIGTWHHYAIAVDRDRVTIYLDGNIVGAGKADRSERTSTQVRLGGSSFGDHLDGALDVVRYYRVTLDAAGVLADMNR